MIPFEKRELELTPDQVSFLSSLRDSLKECCVELETESHSHHGKERITPHSVHPRGSLLAEEVRTDVPSD